MDPNGGGIRVAPMENMNSIEHGHIVTIVSRKLPGMYPEEILTVIVELEFEPLGWTCVQHHRAIFGKFA